MAATNYLEITNNDGKVIINDEYKNLCVQSIATTVPLFDGNQQDLDELAKKQSLLNVIGYNCGTNTRQNNSVFIQLKCAGAYFTAMSSLVYNVKYFARPTYNNTVFVWVEYEGTGSKTSLELAQMLQKDFRLYHFGPTPQTINNNSGLQVWNSAGELIFDSNRRYLEVLECITQDLGVTDSISKGYAAQRIAVVPFSCRQIISAGQQASVDHRQYFRLSGNGRLTFFSAEDEIYGTPPGIGYGAYPAAGQYFVPNFMLINVSTYDASAI